MHISIVGLLNVYQSCSAIAEFVPVLLHCSRISLSTVTDRKHCDHFFPLSIVTSLLTPVRGKSRGILRTLPDLKHLSRAFRLGMDASRPTSIEEDSNRFPLSSQYGTHTIVKTRL